MPLATGYPLLIKAIESAFKAKKAAMEALPKEDPAAREAIEMIFYTELATAIHSYTLSAAVFGGAVAGTFQGVAGPLAPAGMTYAGGAIFGATIPGTGFLS